MYIHTYPLWDSIGCLIPSTPYDETQPVLLEVHLQKLDVGFGGQAGSRGLKLGEVSAGHGPGHLGLRAVGFWGLGV